ncbi:F-box/FBD/LRR-repeat protein At1g13570 [Lactuca sativa]|uniref:F-box domain-containing protein n=1 Tax=Lactuca sativa TaxID=4236 RepID=A0A9R1VLK2_LACSA|nr:F-box/FBD/LRR-repeat protein At1g13570 [Lactuca sativa]KAJ0209632.1 hypothetical protein LSAT_V11C400165020 [Lactuca sativa]
MKAQCQSSDRISTLPEDTIEKILTHMPIRDALRTSILSKKWRYCWTRMPKLVFDDNMFTRSSIFENDISKDYNFEDKIIKAIFQVLLLHKGPISEFCLCIVDAEIVNEIDMIILHLSWNKNIKKFIFECVEGYKLPCSFFSFQELEHLDLRCCKIELPHMFNGFSKLKILKFDAVEITAKMLQRFLTNCPLLEELTLHFAAGGMPWKLPTSLIHLRRLVLDVCFLIQDEISSTLCLINNSPNLEKIQINMIYNGEKTLANLPDIQEDYSGLNLDHLKELEITRFGIFATEMEFLKLIMAKSPLLKKARIELSILVTVGEENKMLRDLLFLPFPRASPAAKFSIERPKY